MRKNCLRLLAGLALALLLPCAAAAYEFPQTTLEQAMADFRAEHGLNETNFAVSYENTVTGETYHYNEQTYFTGGSIYKLPLMMLYRDRILAGEFTEQSVFNGWTFAEMEQQILVHSNNEMGLYLLRSYPSFRSYRTALASYSGLVPETLPAAYWSDNNFCTDFFLRVLEYFYAHSEDTYSTERDYLLQAQPGEYLKGQVSEYDIAQKYGWYNGAVNGVGVVYAPEPYLVAVFTQDVYDGAGVVSAANRLLCDYHDAAYVAAHPAQEPESTPEPAPEPTPEAEPVPEPEPVPEMEPTPVQTAQPEAVPDPEPASRPVSFWLWASLAALLAAGALAALLVVAVSEIRSHRKALYSDEKCSKMKSAK